MFLLDLFRPKMGEVTARRHRIYTNTGESVELPGHGRVQVYCRVACEGEGCPKPQLLTLKALNESPVGAVVEVVTDNLSVVETIPSMMDIYEGVHLGTLRGEENWRIYVRREPTESR